jgi:hypothetical protein
VHRGVVVVHRAMHVLVDTLPSDLSTHSEVLLPLLHFGLE